MGRFRRLLRKAIKPAVFAFVAATVALSLVVTTPSNARAFVGPVIPPPVIAGAAEMILPEVMATSAVLGPVGWGIAGLTALGVGLYYTKDYWLPYVTGNVGAPEPGTTQGPANPGGSIVQSFDFIAAPGASPLVQTLNGIQFTLRYSGTAYQNGFNYGITATLQCKVGGTSSSGDGPVGTIYTTKWGMGSNSGNTGGPYGGDDTWKTYCHRSEDSLQGAVAGAYGAAAELWSKLDTASGMYGKDYPGPMSVGRMGTMVKGDPGFDPKGSDVTYRTTVECVRADGSKFMAQATSVGTDGAIKMAACGAIDPGAHGTGKTTVDLLRPGQPTETVWDVQAPTASPDYPLCDPSRPGSGCKLEVTLDNKPCIVGVFECVNWEDLSKDPNQVDRLGCQYGPYVVPLSTCNPLERSYTPEGTQVTDPNTDGDPGTKTTVDLNGNPVDTSDITPGVITEVPGGEGEPNPNNPEATQCFPGGWAVLNPMWIVDGIKCSFIPKTDIKVRVTTLQDLSKTKAPISWISPNITGPGGAGCPNWVVNIGGIFSENVVCGRGFTDAIISVRYPMFGLISAAMVWPLLRSLWYAAIPVMRVAPSSGGKD